MGRRAKEIGFRCMWKCVTHHLTGQYLDFVCSFAKVNPLKLTPLPMAKFSLLTGSDQTERGLEWASETNPGKDENIVIKKHIRQHRFVVDWLKSLTFSELDCLCFRDIAQQAESYFPNYLTKKNYLLSLVHFMPAVYPQTITSALSLSDVYVDPGWLHEISLMINQIYFYSNGIGQLL